MIDSTSGTSPVSSVLSPHTAARIDADDSGKTVNGKGEKPKNSAALFAPEIDSSESLETSEGKAAVENDKAFHQVSETTQNQPPGSRVDILA